MCLYAVNRGHMRSDLLKVRLARGYAILMLIDGRRRRSGSPGLGSAIERRVIDRELCELEMLAGASGASPSTSDTNAWPLGAS